MSRTEELRPEADTESQPPRKSPAGWQVVLSVSVLALALMAVRWLLVGQGILFGSSRIALVDIVISAVVVITGTALYRRRIGRAAEADGAPSALLTTAVAVLGLPALIGGVLNLVVPATPAGLPHSACAGVQTHKVPYRATTAGPSGNFARSGPGLSFPQSDRFNKDCIVGFSGYCIGDPVDDPVVKGWKDTRWLLAARHDKEPTRTLARWLSGEPQGRRFVSSSYLAPQSPDSKLRYLDKQCPDGLPLPSKVVLTPGDAVDQTTGKPKPGVIGLPARAPHAFNIGFALAVHDPTALQAGTALRQLHGSGEVAPDGTGRGEWDPSILRSQLRKSLVTPITVTVLAVPCVDPLTPAASDTAATLGYRVPAYSDGVVTPTTAPELPADTRERLLNLACDTELSEPR
ncbi:hypothetical protein K7640_01340 [Micromonospora sp. PLK6-60]|uniref:hypothetical protein n=1 Tax=Micromonospora sp. PLK6-60 TaxID=2873383 RepID=UPI001CA5F9AD|nr:hypothetical protein [Micromonospora sp. PLK6-60]MBY8870483.1 hypothetical protein [Micromonospora sp. PLK6-60]